MRKEISKKIPFEKRDFLLENGRRRQSRRMYAVKKLSHQAARERRYKLSGLQSSVTLLREYIFPFTGGGISNAIERVFDASFAACQ